MNRLTEKISNEILVKNKNGNGSRSICYGCDGISNCTTRVCNFYRAMEKLAAYEDTGLEPEEIVRLNLSDTSKEESSIKYYNEMRKYRDELREYKRLEEQGLLIKLPCKVGTNLFYIKKELCADGLIVWHVKEIREIELTEHNIFEIKNNWGKTVFLTREEAEKVLEVV